MRPSLIAIDWGSTRFRSWLLDPKGTEIDSIDEDRDERLDVLEDSFKLYRCHPCFCIFYIHLCGWTLFRPLLKILWPLPTADACCGKYAMRNAMGALVAFYIYGVLDIPLHLFIYLSLIHI